MVPPSGYFRFGSSLSPSECPAGNIFPVPNTVSYRKIVRAKYSSKPITLSKTHSLPTMEGTYLEFTASTPNSESVQSSESVFH
jgi:hypothetical protein